MASRRVAGLVDAPSKLRRSGPSRGCDGVMGSMVLVAQLQLCAVTVLQGVARLELALGFVCSLRSGCRLRLGLGM